MRFDDFDKKMRVYEQSIDQTILPDMYLVARLDGRNFSKFTQRYKKPFDEEFRDVMVATTKDLMENTGFRFVFGYTESDEISLLFHPEDNTFGRKVRKINTALAGRASAYFSSKVGEIVTFDCRLVPLPNMDRVKDYFAWRIEDSHRNSLNGYAYWTLRQDGLSKRAATSALKNKGIAFKNELLFQHGINYNNVPTWQKRGTGLFYKTKKVKGYNPILKEEVWTTRKILEVNYDLPNNSAFHYFSL